jgi:hypothetical protein
VTAATKQQRPLPDAHADTLWSCSGREPGCKGDVRQGDAVFVQIATATGGRACTARCEVCAKAEGLR